MSNTTISGFIFDGTWPSTWGASGTLAIFADNTFVDDTGKVYPAGDPNGKLTGNFVTTAAITVTLGIGTATSFSLPKSDAATPATIRYTISIIDANGTNRGVLYASWHLRESLGDSITFQQWAIDNQQPIRPQPDGAPSTTLMNLAIAAAANSQATFTRAGLTYAQVFDPRKNGALVDGVTDDTTAFQTTVSELNAAGGGIFLVPDGDSVLSGSGTEILLFTAPVVMQGAGWNSRILAKSMTSASTKIVHVKPAALSSEVNPTTVASASDTPGWGCVFRDFAIEAQSGSPGQYAIYMDASNSGAYIRNVLFSHIYIGKIGGTGASPTGIGYTGTVFNIQVDGSCLFKRGLLMNGVADTVSVEHCRFEGPQRAIEYSAVTGATTLNFSYNNVYTAGGVWIKNALRPLFNGNIVESNSDAAGGGQNEGVEPYGHNGALVDFDGTSVGPEITYNVIGSPGGTALDGLRVNDSTLPYIDHNAFNTPLGKYMYVITSSASSPIIGGDVTILGSSSSVSNSSTTTITPAYLYASAQAAAASFAGHLQLTGSSAFGSHPLSKWSLTNRAVMGVGSGSLMGSTSGTPDLVIAGNAYNDGTNWRAVATGLSTFIEKTAGEAIFYGQGSVSADSIVTPTERGRIGVSGWMIGSSGTYLTQAKVYSPTLTPSSVGAATCAEQDFSISGLTTADKIIVNGPAPSNATGIVNARVKAADTLSLTFINPTAGSLTPVSGTYNIIAVRS